MALDQSPATQRIVASYGSGDSTAASFNKPQYLRWYSPQTALDLGDIRNSDIALRIPLGGELGSQTIFLKFSSALPCRLLFSPLADNQYTNQYISFGIADQGLRRLPLLDAEFSLSAESVQAFLSPLTDTTYTLTGYWQEGYVNTFSGFTVPESAIAQSAPQLKAATGELPPGDYFFIVSSSQWQGIYFDLALGLRSDLDLDATGTFSVDASGRFHLVNLSTTAGFDVDGSARVAIAVDLGASIPIGYAREDYWTTGYAESDGATIASPQVADFDITAHAEVLRISL